MIQDGKKVKFNFTLNADGKLVESSNGGPFEYEHGKDQILPGLKKELEGMQENEEKTIVLSPKEAYGEVIEGAFQELPREGLAKGVQPEIGMTLQVQKENGEKRLATISGVRDDSVILDFNHPLAGKTLTFQVKVVEVV